MNQSEFPNLDLKTQEAFIKGEFKLVELRTKRTLDGISNKFNDLIDK